MVELPVLLLMGKVALKSGVDASWGVGRAVTVEAKAKATTDE